MSLKFKANRIGDIAIISAIIVSGVCIFSLVIDIPFGEFITAFFMFLYLEMREKYIEIREQDVRWHFIVGDKRKIKSVQ